MQGCGQAERQFLDACEGKGQGGIKGDHSGSCAIVALLVDDICYIANVGDSRAVMSADQGATVSTLSTDHKPGDPDEFTRIVNNGGTVYQYFFSTPSIYIDRRYRTS